MPGELVQLGGSLAAILALFALARWLGLGADPPQIDGQDDALRRAAEADSAFAPDRVAVDARGHAALLADVDGRIMLLRPHGAHFVGTMAAPGWQVAPAGGVLTIRVGRRVAPQVALVLGADEARLWNRLLSAID